MFSTLAWLGSDDVALLDVEGLSLAINNIPLLDRVCLSVEPGQVLGLVGESGSGKSLTALSIMRLTPRGARAQGRILFGGRDLAALPERQMCAIRGREIGMIFQEPMTALNPLQTIGRQVAEGFRLHLGLSQREALNRAAGVLARVGLPPESIPLSRYPHELSGGQRQRVVVAMAVALEPKLIIADEPTTALDVTTQAQILRLLRRLVAETGAGLVLITHDLAVVNAMADHVAVMRGGQVLEQGRAAEFRTGARHPYARALLDSSRYAPPRRAPDLKAVTLLEVEGLVREYALPRRNPFRPAPRRRAVDGVSFAIRRGECLGLVGESGCGKSTTARAILALEPLQGGTIRFDGRGAANLSGAELLAFRRRVQMVFQDPYGSFDPRHKAGRIIAEPLRLLPDLTQPEARRRVAAALEEVGLAASDASKYPHEFSGGQRQRLAIARALITRPDLIVLDEPVSALDVSIRAQVLALLADLQARLGLSYLFISHDLGVVRAITDRVLVMRDGQIVEGGETAQVLQAPQHPYTRELVTAALRLDRAVSPQPDLAS
ncbi:microcin ABC transporter ATP-binding protein [Alsobacter soli]|uniref:Microcin ABC transporter ATP-binding protein n=1 Tax=Alsobacter soli TaxID=2109933 RepID=A0A2T1HSE1_9HYPH|nr:dipeptide ABC transporter ATP-binding protein [Alsobacter soli]PSC04562.1 microcin ABC transporter ATP-binding protein [Alsobacter soli]